MLAKVPTLSTELFDNAGRMCVCCALGQSCIIGSNAVAEILVTCLKATLISLENGHSPMEGKVVVGFVVVTCGTKIKDGCFD